MSALRHVCAHLNRAVTVRSGRRTVAVTNPNIFLQQSVSGTRPMACRQDVTICRYLSSSPRPSNLPIEEDFSEMTNEQLEDTSTIPGWDLIHSPPGKMPRGALVGTVVSTKMQKTVNVAVDRYKIVPKIRKRMKYTRKFFAHDENEVANLGDLVMIEPCQRISKHKHFMLRKIVRPKGQL